MNIEGLSLDQMRAALSVAQTGSFSAAARQVGRTQSSLSYAVTALEQQLGIALFDRADGRRPRATEAGRILLREIETLLRQAHELQAKANAVSAGLEPEVSVVVDAHYPVGALLPVLHDFQQRFPAVQIRLTIEAMGAVSKEVLEGTSTIGIMASAQDIAPGLVGDALTPIQRVPVISCSHVFRCSEEGDEPLGDGDIGALVQIVLTDRSESTAGRDYAVHSGRTWRVSDLACKRVLLLAGLGWGYMPEHMVAVDLAEGRLRRLHVKGVRDRNSVAVIVIRRRDRILGPASQWFLDRLRNAES
jgi:DNA-binding transcriptional LysR family regulator